MKPLLLPGGDRRRVKSSPVAEEAKRPKNLSKSPRYTD
jgi:hypothetical protein